MRNTIAKVRRQVVAYPVESLCDAFFVFYALWTLLWILAYSANVSFSGLTVVFYFLPLISFLFLALKPFPSEQRTPAAERTAHRDNFLVALFVLAAVLLTLFLHRPDADDEKFLGMALSLLAEPDQPLQSLPGYRTGIYAITSYEPLKAMVSYTTGIPLLHSFYLLIPSLMSALTVIVSYRLLRSLVTDGWFIGLLFFFVVMLAWGDVHRTQANFGFVRMFQGKSVVVTLIVPAILFYYFQFRSMTQSKYIGLLLVCTLASGIGFSRAGYAIGPLLVLVLALTSLKSDSLGRSLKPTLLVILVSAAVILPFVHHFGSNFNPKQLVHTQDGIVNSTTNLEMFKFTMGSGLRGVFLVFCVAVSFFFVKNTEIRYSYRNYVALFMLLLLIPWTSNFFAKTAHSFLSWRWMWILPVPVLASVAVGGAARYFSQVTNPLAALCAFLALTITFTAAAPRRVISKENYTAVRWPQAKLWTDTVYLRPQQSTAAVKNGRLYLEGDRKGY